MADTPQRQRESYVSFLERTLASWKEHHSLHHSSCDFTPAAHTRTSQQSVIGHDTTLTLAPAKHLVNSNDGDSLPQGLQVIQESGCPPTTPPRKRRKAGVAAVKVDDLKWRRVATALVESIPRHAEWKNVLQQCGIYQDLREGKLVANLLDGTALTHMRTSSVEERTRLALSSDTPIDRVMSYAKAAARTEDSAQAAISFAYFQQFLVLSACAVLLRCEKASTNEVYKIAKVCIKNEVSEDYCRQILQTACFLNELLDCLSTHCFGHRASELLLIWKRPVRAFFDLSHSEHSRKASLRHFRSAFTEPAYAFHVDDDEQQRTPIFVPVIIHHILDKAISIPRISHVLGYRNADVLGERINPWQFFQTGAQSRNRNPLEFPHGTSPLQPASNEACEQLSTLNCPQRSCGQSLQEDGILDLARAARPYPVYADHPQVPFAFEMLESEGWNKKVMLLAQSWLKHDIHIHHVEKSVGRRCNSLSDRDNLLRAWCLFKLKQVESAGWKQVSGGLATCDEPQAIILIALEDLGPENGFFMKLRKGEWVCKDGREMVALPPTGGGQGIFFALRM